MVGFTQSVYREAEPEIERAKAKRTSYSLTSALVFGLVLAGAWELHQHLGQVTFWIGGQLRSIGL